MKMDKEYQTMYLREVDFLKNKGIYPSFTKEIEGIKIFKYEKSPRLFNALEFFYARK